jgi:succinoglycan biosynthesis protein ExoW
MAPEENHVSRLAIVTAFYQTTPGLLRQALNSALRQQDAPELDFIIVDDSSPLPLAAELDGLPPEILARITIVRQPNAGPGPARNTGLDAVQPSADWIAFLDSDDVWGDRHLARAVAALEQGYDFCFANLRREGDRTTHYGLNKFDPTQHKALAIDPSLYEFQGDFFHACLTCAPVGTSTVVIRNAVLGGVRFAQRKDIWEDLVFWLRAAKRSTRIAFDSTVQVEYTYGGITKTPSWKTNHHLRNVLYYEAYYDTIGREFELTPPQRQLLASLKHTNRVDFASVVLGIIAEGEKPNPAYVGPFIRRNPQVLATFARILGAKAMRRTFGRSA